MEDVRVRFGNAVPQRRHKLGVSREEFADVCQVGGAGQYREDCKSATDFALVVVSRRVAGEERLRILEVLDSPKSAANQKTNESRTIKQRRSRF